MTPTTSRRYVAGTTDLVAAAAAACNSGEDMGSPIPKASFAALFAAAIPPSFLRPTSKVSIGRTSSRRKLFNTKGERSYKIVRIKVFAPGNGEFEKEKFNAEPGCVFTGQGIDKLLDTVANAIEKRWPDHEYKLLEIGPATYNFVWVKAKDASPAE
jgi:hypothetical protein